MIETRWALAKLGRARGHLAELEAATADWLDPVEHPLAVIVDQEGWRIQALLEMPEQPPPFDQWALIVGDCIHNVRTALDVFVWANSTLLPEAARARAAYPILPAMDDPDDDDEELPHTLEHQDNTTQRYVEGKVRGLPEPLRSRVIGNMRWASGRDGKGGLYWHQRLPLVRQLDDIDKHRIALELETSHSMAHWKVRARDANGLAVDHTVTWNLNDTLPSAPDERVVIATGVPERRVARVVGNVTLSFDLRVRLPGRSLSMHEWLPVFIEDVEELIGILSETD